MHLVSISEMASSDGDDNSNTPGRLDNGRWRRAASRHLDDVRYDDIGILGLPWQGKIGHEAQPMPPTATLPHAPYCSIGYRSNTIQKAP